MKPLFKIILLAVAYLLTYVLGSCTGLIHPACYAYVGAILPLLTAFIYLSTCLTIRGFGAATVLNGFVFVMLLIAGEADKTLAIGFAILTALAEIIRYLYRPLVVRHGRFFGRGCRGNARRIRPADDSGHQ